MNIYKWLTKMTNQKKKVDLRFIEDSIEKSLRSAMRREIERLHKRQDKEMARLVIGKLVQDSRLEILPNRGEESVIFTKKNPHEK